VLVVALDFRPFADGKDESNILGGPAPLSGAADVVGFATDIGREMIGVNTEGSLHYQPVAVTPGEISVNPPQVGPVPVGKQDARLKGIPWRRIQQYTILGRFVAIRKTVVSDPEGQRPGLGFIKLKNGESLQLEKRLCEHVEVGSELGTYGVTRLLRSGCVKHKPECGVKFYIGVDLGPELCDLLRSCGRGGDQNK